MRGGQIEAEFVAQRDRLRGQRFCPLDIGTPSHSTPSNHTKPRAATNTSSVPIFTSIGSSMSRSAMNESRRCDQARVIPDVAEKVFASGTGLLS